MYPGYVEQNGSKLFKRTVISFRRHCRALVVGLLCCIGLLAIPASAAAGPIDGISDQGMPSWDGAFAGSPFTSYFANQWVNGGPHIHYARDVVQWNAMSGEAGYRTQFEEWINDASSLGLTLDLSPTSYD